MLPSCQALCSMQTTTTNTETFPIDLLASKLCCYWLQKERFGQGFRHIKHAVAVSRTLCSRRIVHHSSVKGDLRRLLRGVSNK